MDLDVRVAASRYIHDDVARVEIPMSDASFEEHSFGIQHLHQSFRSYPFAQLEGVDVAHAQSMQLFDKNQADGPILRVCIVDRCCD